MRLTRTMSNKQTYVRLSWRARSPWFKSSKPLVPTYWPFRTTCHVYLASVTSERGRHKWFSENLRKLNYLENSKLWRCGYLSSLIYNRCVALTNETVYALLKASRGLQEYAHPCCRCWTAKMWGQTGKDGGLGGISTSTKTTRREQKCLWGELPGWRFIWRETVWVPDRSR